MWSSGLSKCQEKIESYYLRELGGLHKFSLCLFIKFFFLYFGSLLLVLANNDRITFHFNPNCLRKNPYGIWCSYRIILYTRLEPRDLLLDSLVRLQFVRQDVNDLDRELKLNKSFFLTVMRGEMGLKFLVQDSSIEIFLVIL